MMGIMQAELQGKRKWVSKERFVEGLAVANMVPGATATQLAIFLAVASALWGAPGGRCLRMADYVRGPAAPAGRPPPERALGNFTAHVLVASPFDGVSG